jgi:DNA (cytosine-5)-methyltransferase 1
VTAYYNEIDPYAANELRKLIASGRIVGGDVDERSIADVSGDDIRRYTQCHFFAGIGGWSIALRLAGWPDDRPVWTGSCPCQPFSAAGKRLGFADRRHLWPEWFRIIGEHPPSTIFGEQVPHAKKWLALVRGDLERSGFAFASRKLRASDIGAPHRRARLWFIAHADGEPGWLQSRGRLGACRKDQAIAEPNGTSRPLADAKSVSKRKPANQDHAVTGSGEARSIAGSHGKPLADANGIAPIGAAITWPERDPWRTEPAVGRVVNGLSHKLVEPALRAYGNAIVPQVAAEFIGAAMSVINGDVGDVGRTKT